MDEIFKVLREKILDHLVVIHTPSEPLDAVNKQYLEQVLEGYVSYEIPATFPTVLPVTTNNAVPVFDGDGFTTVSLYSGIASQSGNVVTGVIGTMFEVYMVGYQIWFPNFVGDARSTIISWNSPTSINVSNPQTVVGETFDIIDPVTGIIPEVKFKESQVLISPGGNVSGVNTLVASGLVSMNGGGIVPISQRLTLNRYPTDPTDATNKLYVDTQVATAVLKPAPPVLQDSIALFADTNATAVKGSVVTIDTLGNISISGEPYFSVIGGGGVVDPGAIAIGPTGNTTNTGNNNLFFGKEAGMNNTIGDRNVFIGERSGYNNVIGQHNVFVGDDTGSTNISGDFNVCIGSGAGNNIDGFENTIIGYLADVSNPTNVNSIVLGANALATAANQFAITDSITHIRVVGLADTNLTNPQGNMVVRSITDSSMRIASGISAFEAGIPSTSITTGTLVVNGGIASNDNISAIDPTSDWHLATKKYVDIAVAGGGGGFNGNYAFFNATGPSAHFRIQGTTYLQFTGGTAAVPDNLLIGPTNTITTGAGAQFNTIVGHFAGGAAMSALADANTLLGYNAGSAISDGNNNVYIGANSGATNTDGVNNVFIGSGADGSVGTRSGSIALGSGAIATADDQFAIRDSITQAKMVGLNTTGTGNVVTWTPAGIIQNNSGVVTSAPGTASTNSTTGVLVLTGGLGVSQNANIGGSMTVAGGFPTINTTASSSNYQIQGVTYLEYGYGTAALPNTVFVGPTKATSLNIGPTAEFNTIVGSNAGGVAMTNGADNNTLFGNSTGNSITGGFANTFIGSSAGSPVTSGNSNTFIGYSAGSGVSATIIGSIGLGTLANPTADNQFTVSDTITHARLVGLQTTGTGNVITWTPAGLVRSNAGVTTTTSGTSSTTIGTGVLVLTGGLGISENINAGGTINSTAMASNYQIQGTGYLSYNGGTASGPNALLVGPTTIPAAAGVETTIIGSDAGSATTSGSGVTLLGYRSGNALTIGTNNTLLGALSGRSIIGGSSNTFIGYDSGPIVTSGTDNVVIGVTTATTLGTGNNNIIIGNGIGLGAATANTVIIGHNAVCTETVTGGNVSIGMESSANASRSVSIGYRANYTGDPSGTNVTAIGYESFGNGVGSLGINNVGVGYQSGFAVTDGFSNTLIGTQSGLYLTTGSRNTFIGNLAGSGVGTTTRSNATVVGYNAGLLLGNGSTVMGSGAVQLADAMIVTAFGFEAGRVITTGNENTLFGYHSGYSINSGTRNVLVGHETGVNMTNADNAIAIGYQAAYNTTEADNFISIGFQAGFSATTGNSGSIMIGAGAGYKNDVAGDAKNIMIGFQSGYESGLPGSGPTNSIFIGEEAGRGTINSAVGNNNIFVGLRSGFTYTTGFRNIAIGYESAYNLTTGQRNVVIGDLAFHDVGGTVINSVAIGVEAGVGSLISSGDNNVFIGFQSGYSFDTAFNNVCIGFQSGYYTTASQSCVFIGTTAGYGSPGLSTGPNNVFIGRESGYSYTTANDNVAIGYRAAYNITSADSSVIIGRSAGFNVTTGNNNIIIGDGAGFASTTGFDNVLIGYRSAFNMTTADSSVIIGKSAGFSVNTNSSNILIGDSTGYSLTGNAGISAGINNVVIGKSALRQSDSSSDSVIIGTEAGYSMTAGDKNVIIGYRAAYQSDGPLGPIESVFIGSQAGRGTATSTGDFNVFIGKEAGYSYTTGMSNVIVGNDAGYNLTTGDTNVIIGKSAFKQSTTSSNCVIIGNLAGFEILSGNRNTIIGFDSDGSVGCTGNDNVVLGPNNLLNGVVRNNCVLLGSQLRADHNNVIMLGVSGALQISTAANQMTITDNITEIVANGIHNGATTAAVASICSGTYTPASVAVANVTINTVHTAQWMRVGAVVTVSGRVDITPTAGVTLTRFTLALPITSATTNLAGSGSSTTPDHAVSIVSSGGNALLSFTSSITLAARVISYTYTYVVT